MPKSSIRKAAKLLGQLSGLKRGSPPDKKLMQLSQKQKHLAAVTLGTLGKDGGSSGGLAGGRAGGLARAAVLSAKRRKAIAKKAAKARWKAHKKEIAGF